jgi:amino acid transporter
MGGPDCCRGCYFLLTTLLTVGFVLAILIAGFVFGQTFKVFEYDKNLMVYLIIAMIGVLLVFFLFLWVSCRKTKGGRSILSVVFLLFDVGLFVISIVAFVQHKTVLNTMQNLWMNESSETQKSIAVSLEAAFGCCGWDHDHPSPEGESCGEKHSNKGDCSDIIQPKVKKYWNLGAGLLLGFAVVLLVMVVFAFRIACQTGAYEQIEDPKSISTANTSRRGRTGTNPSYTYNW